MNRQKLQAFGRGRPGQFITSAYIRLTSSSLDAAFIDSFGEKVQNFKVIMLTEFFVYYGLNFYNHKDHEYVQQALPERGTREYFWE